MTRARQVRRTVAAVTLALTVGLAGCVTVPTGRTDSTTVRVQYAPGSLTDAEAQAQARAQCGGAEVTKTSAPETLPSGQFQVTATCLASYDRSGNLVPND